MERAMNSDEPEPFPREPIPPDILEWARQTFNEEEFLAEIREIEATRGVRFEDLIAEVEAIAVVKGTRVGWVESAP
jgi:hypothetical protein